jgi:AcrR family transcriptional regulator
VNPSGIPLVRTVGASILRREESTMARAGATRSPTTTPSAPAPASSLRDDAKAMFRQAVLDAAEQIFATEGVHRARIQDIAKLARVSVGTIYNHFAQKEDIVAALLAERERELFDAFAIRPDDPQDFLGRFNTRNERMLTLFSKHQAFFRFALYEGIFESDVVPAGSVFAVHEAAFEKRMARQTEELLEQGMDEGVVERQDPVRLKRFISGAMRGVMLAALRDPDVDPVEEGRFAFEMCLRALRPASALSGAAASGRPARKRPK